MKIVAPPSNPSEESETPYVFERTPHIMIVCAPFYRDVAGLLLGGATRVLDEAGATYEAFTVPGALEIPAAIRMACETSKPAPFDAYVALGCVIRGETTHYDIVSEESCRGLMTLATRYGLCIGNGILTVETMEQALERADPTRLDKGAGAAHAALMLYGLSERLSKPQTGRAGGAYGTGA